MSTNFRWKGAWPTNQCWCHKTRVIALLCGIKISAVHCLVLSQSMRVTDDRTYRRNYDSEDCASIALLHGKNDSVIYCYHNCNCNSKVKPIITELDNCHYHQILAQLAELFIQAGHMMCASVCMSLEMLPGWNKS